jgi:hypothetical protein
MGGPKPSSGQNSAMVVVVAGWLSVAIMSKREPNGKILQGTRMWVHD